MLDALRSSSINNEQLVSKMTMINKFKNIKPWMWLILILVFSIFLRIIFFTGPCCDDDAAYLESANKLLQGDLSEIKNNYSFAYRTLMVLPISFFFKIFGSNAASSSIYIILCSVGSVAIAYYIGKILFNEKIGLLSSFLLSFYPLEVIYSSNLVPDIPLAFLMGLGIYFFLKGEDSGKQKYYFISGIVIGLAYLVKITGVLGVLFVLGYLLIKAIFKINFFEKQNSKLKLYHILVIFLLGFLLIFFVETVYNYYFTHIPLGRYQSHIEAQKLWESGIMRDLSFYPHNMLNLNFRPSLYCGYFFYFIFFSLIWVFIYGLRKKEKKVWIPVLWFLSIFLYLEFGSMELFRYNLIHRLIRFLAIVSIPGVISLALFLTMIYKFKNKKSKFIVLFIVLFLFFTSLQSIHRVVDYDNSQVLGDTRGLYEVFKTLPQKDIYFFQYTREFGILKSYFGFENENLKLIYDTPCSAIKNAYIVVDDNRWYFEGGPKYPECFKNPSVNWELIQVIDQADKGIYKTFNPKIYYAP